MLPEAAGDGATAAEVEVQVDVLGATAVEVTAVAPTTGAVDVPKNSAAGVGDGGGAAGVVIGTRVVGADVEVICAAGGVITAGVVVAGMALS